MRKLVLLMFFVLLGNIVLSGQNQPVPGIYHVKVSPDMAEAIQLRMGKAKKLSSTSGNVKTGIISFDAITSDLGVVEMRPMFPANPKYAKSRRKAGLDLWYVVAVNEGVTPKTATQSFLLDPHIQLAQPFIPPTMYSDPNPVDDPMLDNMWHFNNTGQYGGDPGFDINLFKAWEKQMSAKNVIVAILDGGVDVTHEDLKDNLWINEAELNGQLGVDDDGDGYIDDVHGFNFVHKAGSMAVTNHGTHVAGTVGAVNNNGKGVASVAGGSGNNDGVRLMACQVLYDSDNSTNGAEAFVYAAEHGAVIAQCSWGWEVADVYDQATLDAINYFIENAGKDDDGNPLPGTPMFGGIVFFAAGNTGGSGNLYPGCIDEVVAVSSLTLTGDKVPSASFGEWVDITAPGGSGANGAYTSVLSTFPNNNYNSMSGTSMACPQVSGVAALVLAKYGSEAYTPDMLKQRILASSNEEKLYQKNERYRGLLGVGLLDAAAALEVNESIPPVAVTDLADSLVTQKSFYVVFTAPSDEDNGNAYRYELRYSTTQITEANFDKQSVVYQDANAAGTHEAIHVSNLAQNTTYYVALKSLDIWGNKSSISNIITVSTVTNPVISVTPSDTIRFTIDVTTNPVHRENLNIANVGEGVMTFEMNHNVVKDPRNLLTTDKYGYIYTYEQKEAYPQRVVGTSGTTNQRFIAANEMIVTTDEFTLTHVRTGVLTHDIDFNIPTEDFLIKVIKGGDTPDKGELLCSKPQSYRKTFNATDYDFDLGEQITFVKGEKFWLVLDFPENYVTPIGVNIGLDNLYSRSIFSEDDYKTWSDFDGQLDPSIFIPKVAFRIIAVEKQKAFDQFVSFTPQEGNVSASSSVNVAAAFDASNIVNGDYVSKINIFNDDANSGKFEVPVKFNVIGHLPTCNLSATELNYGTVVIGQNKALDLVVENNGLGTLDITTELADNTFRVNSATLSILPFEKATLRVSFYPNASGNFPKSLKLHTNIGDYVVYLDGTGAQAPEANINPDSLYFTGRFGDETTDYFYIKNTGQFKLDYSMPAYMTSGLSTYSMTDKGTGYTVLRSTEAGGPTFKWDDMTDAIDYTTATEVGYKIQAVDLGFKVNYYGNMFDKITITSLGFVMFGDVSLPNTPNNSIVLPTTSAPANMLAAMWYSTFKPTTRDGKVLYKQFQDYVVIEYNHVGKPAEQGRTGLTPPSGTVDVQIMIHSNGSIEYRYNNYVRLPSEDARALFGTASIGFQNGTKEDGIQIARNNANFLTPGNQLSIGIYPPGPSVIKKVTPSSGIVIPGDSVKIAVDMKMDELRQEGTYTKDLQIITSDPTKSQIALPVVITLLGDSKPYMLSNDSIDMGSIGVGLVKKAYVRIYNDGAKAYNILNAQCTNSEFTVTNTGTSDTCLGYSSVEFEIAFQPSAAQVYNDELVIQTNVTGYEYFRVPLKAEGVLNPTINITSNLSGLFTLESGTYVDTAIYIENTGAGTLSYVLGGTHWIKQPEQAQLMSASFDNATGYYWSDSDTDSSVVYEWEGISVNAKKEDKVKQGVAIRYDLPFTFTFYGKEYDYLALGAHGMVVFPTPDRGYILDASNRQGFPIPRQGDINNVICPFHVGLTPNGATHLGKLSAVYSDVRDDKVIFSWVELPSSVPTEQMQGLVITFQMVLYKDGRIKFQYRDVESPTWRNNAIIGIENADGTEGIEIANNGKFVHNEFAIMISPGKKTDLAPGAKHRIPVRIDASDLYDGTYQGKLYIGSNDPAHTIDSIPVNLKVNGLSQLLLQYDTIDFGKLYVYQESGDFVSYSKEFMIANVGTNDLVINSIASLPADVTVTGVTFPLTLAPQNFVWANLVYKPTTLPANNKLSESVVFAMGGDRSSQTDGFVVEAQVYYPPVAVVDSTIKNFVYSKKLIPKIIETADTTFILGNTGGDSLEYKWEITYLSEEDYYAQRPATRTEVVAMDESLPAGLNIQQYNNNDNLQTPYHSYNFVDSMGWYTNTKPMLFGYSDNQSDVRYATRFKAGNEGFNLTHVANWYSTLAENLELEIIILAGKDYRTATERLSQKKVITSDPSLGSNGSYVIDELATSLYFYPNEYFWVVYRYQNTYEYYQSFFKHGNDNLVDDFVIQVDDIIVKFGAGQAGAGNDFINCGYVMEAYSAEKLDNVESWIKLTPNKGSMDVNSETPIKIDLDATAIPGKAVDRFARVDLVSNDPLQENVSIYVEMLMNTPPQIYLGRDASSLGYLDVNCPEGLDTIVVQVRVADVDGDDFTLNVELEGDAGGEKPLVGLLQSNTPGLYYFAAIRPYGSAGTWKYKITAKDTNNLESSANISLIISKTNRAPITTGISDTVVYYQNTINFDVTEFFNDPDGDALTYSVMSANSDIVSTQITGASNLNLSGITIGNTVITVTATDVDGASVSTNFNVTVDNEPEIPVEPEITNTLKLYPNPVIGDWITFKTVLASSSKIEIRIYNTNGSLLYRQEFANQLEFEQRVNVSDFPSGIYIVQYLVNGKKVETKRFIK